MGGDYFWRKWSDSGIGPDDEVSRFCSTRILKGLLKERQVLRGELVREAESDLDFMKSAVYMKNNVEFQVLCPEALVRHYLNRQS